jgi:D-alanyl-D-alanine carboxypeptidase/D-alanyl-D-alanine-endopeptidase (penicillin-binding protein 4)
VNLTTAILKDGCGLAPQDAISAETFVSLLEYMTHSGEFEPFYASLPVSGRSGTLCGFLGGTALEGRVHAKSGTIAGTKNYAGYIELPDGRRWVFAVLVNSATGKTQPVKHIIERYLLDVYRRNTQH